MTGTLPMRTQSGFTLLELIVVIVIAALVMGVVFGSMGVLLQSQERVGRISTNQVAAVAERDRIRAVLSSLFPGEPGTPDQVQGESRRFSGRTQAPLLGWNGRPTPFELVLDYDLATDSTRLMYTEEDRDAIVLLEIPGDGGRFAYATENLDWSERWPPAQRSQLLQPTLVRIHWGSRPDEVLVAYTAGFTDLPMIPTQLGATQ